MKPALLFSVLAVIAIVVLTSFSTGPGEWMGIAPQVHRLRADIDIGTVLYVCPAADMVWDDISKSLQLFRSQILMFFFGLLLFLFAAFGWAMYRDLIGDKFSQNHWKFTVSFATTLFWGTIIVAILMYSPNYFKTVGVRGSDQRFILCESSTPGSRPVRESAVVLRSKISS
jgi:hypothetical protein